VFTTYDAAGFTIDQQIVEISEQWAQLKALPEMKFTLGGIEELRDDRVALLYAIDSTGEVLGVTSWLPTYRDGRVIGWTLDFMRHRTDSPNGIMEFLIARMAERLRDEGQANPANAVEFMSLSAAPLAGMNEKATAPNNTGEQSKKKQSSKAEITTDKGNSAKNTVDGKAEQSAQPDDDSKDMDNKASQNGPSSEVSASKNVQKSKPTSPTGTEIIEHALQIAADVLEPAYGFKSLFFFKKKFQPSPAPIYICYPDSAKLAQIGFAVVNAYVPELKPKQVVEIMKTMTSADRQ
jgi:phosphatidylglycerol lysyltransferase